MQTVKLREHLKIEKKMWEIEFEVKINVWSIGVYFFLLFKEENVFKIH